MRKRIRNDRIVSILIALSLLASAAFAFSVARREKVRSESSLENTRNVLESKRAVPEVKSSATDLPEQASGQFDLSRDVIAGGGGRSTGGNLTVTGTIGQAVVGTQSIGGPFSATGGFWNTLDTAIGPPPTPTPSPTPSPAPTPTLPLLIFTAADNPNEAAAIDSVTFVRGPFKTRSDHNFSADHQTRVLLVTTPLGLTQADVSRVTVTVAGISLTVENVGPLLGTPGLEASYIVVRLFDGLPPGNLPLIVIVNGVQSSNSPTLSIAPP